MHLCVRTHNRNNFFQRDGIKWYQLGWLQVQYSLLSKGPQQRDIKEVCDGLGLQLIAYSPLVSLSVTSLCQGISSVHVTRPHLHRIRAMCSSTFIAELYS